MHYEVQEKTPRDGWQNRWFYNDGDGRLRLETFATREEAEAALDEFFADLAEDIAAGFCPPCIRDEFRVQFVSAITTDLNNNPQEKHHD
jgi:hypothetical protein